MIASADGFDPLVWTRMRLRPVDLESERMQRVPKPALDELQKAYRAGASTPPRRRASQSALMRPGVVKKCRDMISITGCATEASARWR